jgi:hypothetical protein
VNTIDLPIAFFTDRRERDLPMPTVIAYLKRKVRVAADDPVIPDYLSDADYYSDIVRSSGDVSYVGLQSSARATVKAIKESR